MSTVTTRLCRYCHKDCDRHPNAKTECSDTVVQRVEELVADGATSAEMVALLGASPHSLRRRLERLGRLDLARLIKRPVKPPRSTPRCALAGCKRYATWVEEEAYEDYEAIAEWSYLCSVHQEEEDLCEDLEFLLDPNRGGESDTHAILKRVGYPGTHSGLEAIRQRLKRWGRVDLRTALNLDAPKAQQPWYLQGTVRPISSNLSRWAREVSRFEVQLEGSKKDFAVLGVKPDPQYYEFAS